MVHVINTVTHSIHWEFDYRSSLPHWSYSHPHKTALGNTEHTVPLVMQHPQGGINVALGNMEHTAPLVMQHPQGGINVALGNWSILHLLLCNTLQGGINVALGNMEHTVPLVMQHPPGWYKCGTG